MIFGRRQATVETYDKKWHCSVRESGIPLFFGTHFWILDVSSWLYIQLFTRNPNLQSEFTNSFTLRRKLRKTSRRESRFLIVIFLIISPHRSTGGLVGTDGLGQPLGLLVPQGQFDANDMHGEGTRSGHWLATLRCTAEVPQDSTLCRLLVGYLI